MKKITLLITTLMIVSQLTGCSKPKQMERVNLEEMTELEQSEVIKKNGTYYKIEE